VQIEVVAERMAVGGEAVGHEDGGRVVFVAGALPGERVRVEITDERKRFARGEVAEVLEPSTDRVAPPCPHVARGCGGCGWQHVLPDVQRLLKREIVEEVLRRQAHIADPVVVAADPLDPESGRTTVRGLVVGGRFGFRQRRSHDPVIVDSCLVTHPLLQELIADGRWGSAHEVTLRAGVATSERLAIVTPSVDRAATTVPDDVRVVGADELQHGHRAWIHEEVTGRTWRISATSFFQSRPDGAAALVDQVAATVDELAPDAERLVDLCSGVGLFAGTVGADRQVVAVERHRPAVADAKVNLAGLDVRAIRATMASWRPSPADVVVADPARSGLGKPGVAAVLGTAASTVVLVSCDPGALGRDAALLIEAGYVHTGSTVIDLFPHTPHVEVVSGFRKAT